MATKEERTKTSFKKLERLDDVFTQINSQEPSRNIASVEAWMREIDDITIVKIRTTEADLQLSELGIGFVLIFDLKEGQNKRRIICNLCFETNEKKAPTQGFETDNPTIVIASKYKEPEKISEEFSRQLKLHLEREKN